MRRFAFACLTAFSVVACKKESAPPAPPSGAATLPPKPPEFSKISEGQRARKARSEARLRQEGVPISASLPVHRYDWACVDARVTGKPAPAAIDCEIVVERHRALNWLYGYEAQPWDDVSTDT